jgi:hypothetical protein
MANRGKLVPMNFQDMHELVRIELVRRIERGTLTGNRLASQAGFKQAHISNFLNRKRALSLEGLDRVLASQNLSIDQLLPVDLEASAGEAADPIEVIPVVSASVAMEDGAISKASVIETVPVSASRLYNNRPRLAERYAQWQRFLAIRADVQQAAAMAPLVTQGAIVVLDRHYNSVAPYRTSHQTIYAVRSGKSLLLRFVEIEERHLILRPYSREFPVELLQMGAEESPADFIVGRVCLAVSEL